jgi:hypothetical protein
MHSAGGITVAHVLNAVPARIARVVLVSCTIPPHGSAVIDHIDPDVRESVMAGRGSRQVTPVRRCGGSGRRRRTVPG